MTSQDNPKHLLSPSEIETIIDALRSQEVDAIIGDSSVLMLRLREAEKNLRESEARLQELNRTLETRIDERTADLEKLTFRLRKLAHELTHTEQRERKRLAQILHDGLQQILIAIEVNLSMLMEEYESEELHRVMKLLHEATATSRSLAYELAPPILYEATFSEALAWLARWFSEKYSFHVNVNIESQIPTLTENAKVFLFNVIRELLINSVKHSGVHEATIYCGIREEEWWEIKVQDTGTGFDPATIKGGNKLDGGFGLLSIRERLLAFGGHLTIDSAPGNGSHFLIQLPVSIAELDRIAPIPAPVLAEPDESIPIRAKPQSQKVRVLLVDDHRVVREALVAMLQREKNIEVVGQAGDGLEAIELTNKLRPDIIVMDISMPKMDGVEATRRIKEMHPDIAIVGLSLHEEADKGKAIYLAGATAYLNKETAAKTLIDTLLNITL
jgi:signal transduction histidine kinase